MLFSANGYQLVVMPLLTAASQFERLDDTITAQGRLLPLFSSKSGRKRPLSMMRLIYLITGPER